MTIEAIPTEYHGHTFRSRTEARWAVFFDRIGLLWVYEPEGFKLEVGWYLPDFWLPEMKMWAEVKPYDGPTPQEKEKGRQLVAGTTYPLLFLNGPPRHDSYRIYCLEGHGDGVEAVVEWGCHFSGQYTVKRVDGRPRLFMADNGEAAEDKYVESAATQARAIDLTDPDARLPVGWEGVELPW